MRRLSLLALALALLGGCSGPVTLICAGDVMLGRGVAEACRERGPDYPFAEVAPRLRRADLAFANLEGPLTDRTSRYPRVNALRASPRMAPALRAAGFDVLSLANNHAIDYGRPGLSDTLDALHAAGLVPVGAGRTQAEAEAGAVLTVRGLRLGFLAFSDFPWVNFVPDPQRESVLTLSEETLRRTLPPLAARCDVLVVSFHWGREGERDTEPRQRELARLAVDLGARLVVGHHAHVRGELEHYRGALIAYCLGNLVFDEHSYGGNEGYLLEATFSPRGDLLGHQASPVRVQDCRAWLDGP